MSGVHLRTTKIRPIFVIVNHVVIKRPFDHHKNLITIRFICQIFDRHMNSIVRFIYFHKNLVAKTFGSNMFSITTTSITSFQSPHFWWLHFSSLIFWLPTFPFWTTILGWHYFWPPTWSITKQWPFQRYITRVVQMFSSNVFSLFQKKLIQKKIGKKNCFYFLK